MTALHCQRKFDKSGDLADVCSLDEYRLYSVSKNGHFSFAFPIAFGMLVAGSYTEDSFEK